MAGEPNFGSQEKAGHSGRDDSAKLNQEKDKSGRPEGRPLFFAGGREPAEVGLGSAGDGEDQKFGGFVGVEAEDFPFERF